MLQKKRLTGRKVEVTFRMPPMDDVVELYLCGDFNHWQVKGLPLALESDGTWVGRLVLDAGKSYRFRYHDNQGRWLNDDGADAYVPNDFGSDDSLLDLNVAAKEPPKGKAAKKDVTPRRTPGNSKTTRRRAKPQR